MSQYFGKWARERKLACSNCCLEEYFTDEVSVRNAVPFGYSFSKSQVARIYLFQANIVVNACELHCLVTIFDGQAILSSDYITH